MLEEAMIKYCAPVLAGIKTANMFNYRFSHIDELHKELKEENRKLNEKGVHIEVLKSGDSRALIYVYRKLKLEQDLSHSEAAGLLKDYGYPVTETKECLARLKERFCCYEFFPHEVGLFLGYPVEDVRGFIEHKGKNYKCSGIWKVYGNETETKKFFRKLRDCSSIYKKLFESGKSIMELTVAA